MKNTVLKLPHSQVECSHHNLGVYLFVVELNSSALEAKVGRKEGYYHRENTCTPYDGTEFKFIVSLGVFTITKDTPLELRNDRENLMYYQHLCFGTMITILHALSLFFCHSIK